MTVLVEGTARPEEIALGVALRGYGFDDHKTKKGDPFGPATFMCTKPEEAEAAAAPRIAVAEGVHFTRDLVNEPANVLTTTEFAKRLEALRDLGVEVEVLEEKALEKLGMRALLAASLANFSSGAIAGILIQ